MAIITIGHRQTFLPQGQQIFKRLYYNFQQTQLMFRPVFLSLLASFLMTVAVEHSGPSDHYQNIGRVQAEKSSYCDYKNNVFPNITHEHDASLNGAEEDSHTGRVHEEIPPVVYLHR